jgi:hypothetical protein
MTKSDNWEVQKLRDVIYLHYMSDIIFVQTLQRNKIDVYGLMKLL